MVMGFKTEIAGKPTHFAAQIRNGTKIHSIRKGNRWKPGMLIHPATGVRTPNYKLITGGPLTCISTQEIKIDFEYYGNKVDWKRLSSWYFQIDGAKADLDKLAINDGFPDFYALLDAIWTLHPTGLQGQIVHWTDYRY